MIDGTGDSLCKTTDICFRRGNSTTSNGGHEESNVFEMSDMMTKKIFLEICMGIEGLCANLYHHYGLIYEDIPEAAGLWEKTALEEENHRKQFGLAIRLWNETEFELLRGSMRHAYVLQFKMLELTSQIKNSRPNLLTAISKAVEMEEKLTDLHVHTALKFKEDSLRLMFKGLGEADHDHAAELQRYRSTLCQPLAEITG